jgi:hypothetical protein
LTESDLKVIGGYPVMPETPVEFARAAKMLGPNRWVRYQERILETGAFVSKEIARFLYGESAEMRYNILSAFYGADFWNESLDTQILHIVGQYCRSDDRTEQMVAAMAAARALGSGGVSLRELLKVCNAEPPEPQVLPPAPKLYTTNKKAPDAVYELATFGPVVCTVPTEEDVQAAKHIVCEVMRAESERIAAAACTAYTASVVPRIVRIIRDPDVPPGQAYEMVGKGIVVVHPDFGGAS